MTDTLIAPLFVRRETYVHMVDAAKRAAADPAQLRDLLDAIDVLEKERAQNEWTVDDDATMEAIGRGYLIGDENGYYNFVWPEERDSEKRPLRTLWESDDRQQIVVVIDQPAIPSETVKKLVKFGALCPQPIHVVPQGPFTTLSIGSIDSSSHFEARHLKSPWRGVKSSEKNVEGGWLISGNDEPVAWVAFGHDVENLANCMNMVFRLENDVSRYGGGASWSFRREIAQQGIVGLISTLRHSISPTERFEEAPPKELEYFGIGMVQDVRQFIADARPHRFNGPPLEEDRPIGPRPPIARTYRLASSAGEAEAVEDGEAVRLRLNVVGDRSIYVVVPCDRLTSVYRMLWLSGQKAEQKRKSIGKPSAHTYYKVLEPPKVDLAKDGTILVTLVTHETSPIVFDMGRSDAQRLAGALVTASEAWVKYN